MPIFKIDIEKRQGDEYWTNRYLVELGALSEGEAAGLLIVDAERAFHTTVTDFLKLRISDLVPATDQFVSLPLGGQGLAVAGTSPLPLFNTVRVDFPAGFGRPSRKYYRGLLYETNTEGGAVSTGTLGAIQAALDGLIAVGFLVDPQGTVLGSPTVYERIQMRQLRRGARRKTPVLP